MPVIPRSAPKPLPPEGPAVLQIELGKTTYGLSKEKKTPFFGLSLKDLKSGLTFTDKIYLTAGSAWRVDALCKSAGLTLSNGAYRLTTDDIDGRICYGPIVYETQEGGRQFAKMKSFWSRPYALQQCPEIDRIPVPAGSVISEVTLPLVEIDPAAVSATPKPAPAAAPAPTPVAQEPPTVETSDEEESGISDEELAEAFAMAKAIKAKKATEAAGK
jgi:hypothetical protein